jgi:UDPglucose--hexose-1-phosphate uridylyltransferase
VPELRRDPTTGAWTIIAAERAARPGGHRSSTPPAGGPPAPSCPFCLGHEAQTPPEILRLPRGADRWSVRVVPNKYPAFTPAAADDATRANDLLASRPAHGHHEVIVEGPAHRLSAVPPGPAVLRDVFLAARERYRAFERDAGLGHAALFKNHGRAGGASLPHPHWQLVALPIVPPAVEREMRLAAEHHATHGESLWDELVRREREDGTRLVELTDDFVVLAAFAPQWEGETWIVPRASADNVAEMDDRLTMAFATVLTRALQRVAAVLDEPPLNVVIHSAPLRRRAADSFRWHARIQPRLGTQAGFELGSGVAIVTMSPEAAAQELRKQKV